MQINYSSGNQLKPPIAKVRSDHVRPSPNIINLLPLSSLDVLQKKSPPCRSSLLGLFSANKRSTFSSSNKGTAFERTDVVGATRIAYASVFPLKRTTVLRSVSSRSSITRKELMQMSNSLPLSLSTCAGNPSVFQKSLKVS